MVKVAESRARLGEKSAAIEALRIAFLEGKSARADAYFEIAPNWSSGTGLSKHGSTPTTAASSIRRAAWSLQGRIAARLRQYSALDSDRAIQAAAQAAQDFFTPEEKSAFAHGLDELKSPTSPGSLSSQVCRMLRSAI